MKNTLKLLATVFLAAFVSLGAAAQGKDYKIELSFKDAKAGGKYIFKSKDLAENFSDTITLKKDGEKVTFKKVYTEPFSLNFFYQGPVDEKPQIGNGIFIDGPQTLKISAPEVKDLVIATKAGGIFDNALIQSIEAKTGQTYRKFMAYQDASKANDKPKADSLMQDIRKISAEIKDIQKEYIAKNPQSVYSAVLLTGMLRDDLKEIEPLFDAFSADVKVSKYGKQIADKFVSIKAIQPGQPAPDFSLTDIDGKNLKLSDFRGKWVLLDFWGSWCIWCRRGNPSLVELYEKYGGKDFEIIGLAARDKEDAWKKAIEDDHLTWKHANLEMNEGSSDLPAKYNVAGYPTKILVDPEGNISVISVGYHEKDDPIVLKIVESLGETYVK